MLRLSILVVALSLAAPIPAAEAPFQDLTFDQALAAAKQSRKIVMIDFFTTWCGPCKRLDKVTWKDAAVVKWLGETTVPLKIDAEKEVALAKRMGVVSYPTIAFVKPDGTKIDAIIGFKPPEEFLVLAKELLAGKGISPDGSFDAAETDPVKRQERGETLAKAGKLEEALAEYLWCFDHGNQNPTSGYSGTRLSFLLTRIKSLGQQHPPAIRALEERRDKAEAAVLSGKANGDTAADMAALNRVLGEQKRNLAAYDQLKKGSPLDPEIAKPIARAIAKLLIEAQRYKDVVDDVGDVESIVRQEIESMQSASPIPSTPNEASAKALERAQASFRTLKVDELALWYEALLGAGRTDAAKKVADELLEFAPAGPTYAALIDRSLRVEATEVARAFVERGRASLPEKEKPFLEVAARRVPAAK